MLSQQLENKLYKLGLDFHKIPLKDQKIPELQNNLIFMILRGIFDSNGDINTKKIYTNELTCNINIRKKIDISILEFIYKIVFKNNDINKDINNDIFNNILTIKDEKALYFLSKIYDNSDARFRSNTNYSQYLNWLGLKKILECSIDLKENALISRNLNLNYDVYIISKIKNIGSKFALFDTGIILKPECGYYFDVIAKNSLYEIGYVLHPYQILNNETIKICLMKIDDVFPDISLPSCHFQLVLKKHIHCLLEYKENF